MLTVTKTRPVDLQIPKKSRLSTMDVFQNIPYTALQEIEKYMVERTYGKRESIFLENDPAEFVWFVKEGYVKEGNHSLRGRGCTLSMIGPHGMFGIAAFEGGDYGFHSLAETNVTVVSFPIRDFRILMGKYPDMARAVVSKIAKLLRQSKNMRTFSQESAEKRLIHVLVEMMGEFGGIISMTRREIALMAGISTETCIRTFTRLRDAGLITSVHGRLMVKSVEDLQDRMEGL